MTKQGRTKTISPIFLAKSYTLFFSRFSFSYISKTNRSLFKDRESVNILKQLVYHTGFLLFLFPRFYENYLNEYATAVEVIDKRWEQQSYYSDT